MSVPVGIIVSSKSDLAFAEAAVKVLGDLDIGCEMRILSAHRTPDGIASVSPGG